MTLETALAWFMGLPFGLIVLYFGLNAHRLLRWLKRDLREAANKRKECRCGCAGPDMKWSPCRGK